MVKNLSNKKDGGVKFTEDVVLARLPPTLPNARNREPAPATYWQYPKPGATVFPCLDSFTFHELGYAEA